jgi:4-alpha-glucanotransferase
LTGHVCYTFGIHNHQPVGNFPDVFEYATKSAYQPFLEILDRYPDIRMSFHFTGILLEWLLDNHPEMIEMIRRMVERGQVEMMTGGYYEPILPMISDRDKIGQIKKLTRFIKDQFGTKPRGLWLAERVWEPGLAKPLVEAGVRYVVMDDSHFKMAGFTEDQLLGYYVTEEQGHPLAIFPISEKMRYYIPFKMVEESIEHFRKTASEDGRNLVVLADDGEKFGVWPGTHKWVYQEKWLEKYFEALQANKDWIHVLPFAEYLDQYPSLGPVYLPTASYTEMMQWVLPAEKSSELEKLLHEPQSEPYRPYMRGGYYRNFLVKYRESNNLHKKMFYVSDKIENFSKKKKKEALDALWTGQCNCAYWHGLFGGLYLNHLRKAIYENLIRAENIVDEKNHKEKNWIDIDKVDFFRDGGRCLLACTPKMNLYFDLTAGGALFELDERKKLFNILNTMTRRPEAYHEKLTQAPQPSGENSPEDTPKSIHDIIQVKEEGLASRIHYDWYRRSALIDHFLSPSATLEEFSTSVYSEMGDFVNSPYEASWKTKSKTQIKLWRDGSVWHEEKQHPVRLEKQINIDPATTEFEIRYSLVNQGEQSFPVRFGVEFNFALQAGNTPDRYYVIPGLKKNPLLSATGENKGITEIGLVEEWIGLRIDLLTEEPADFWRFPIETVSNSEGGFERVYQCSTVMPIRQMTLEPGSPETFALKLVISDLHEENH